MFPLKNPDQAADLPSCTLSSIRKERKESKVRHNKLQPDWPLNPYLPRAFSGKRFPQTVLVPKSWSPELPVTTAIITRALP